MQEEQRLTQVADLCARIGEVLMASGAGASDVTATMQAVAWALGHQDPEIDVTFTTLSVSLKREDEQQPVLVLRTVKHRSLDYEVLTRVDWLVKEIVDGGCDLALARRTMNQIVSAPHTMPRWAVLTSRGLLGGSVAVLLGGGPLVVAVATLAAVLIDLVQAPLTSYRLPSFYLQVVGGLVATLLAVGLHAVAPDEDSSLVVTANIVMLLAGIGFMGALHDGLMGFYLTSTARLLEVLQATVGIVAGVSLGLTLGQMVGIDLGVLEPGRVSWVGLVSVVVGGAVAAAAFAASTRTAMRAWLPIAVVAGIASLIFQLVDATQLPRPWAAGAAALFVGLVAYGVARRIRVPPLVISVAAVVPLLPGLSIYRGMSMLSSGQGNTVGGLIALVIAVSTAGALAAGVLLGEYVAQPVTREARRLESRLAGPRLVGVSRVRGRHGSGRRRSQST